MAKEPGYDKWDRTRTNKRLILGAVELGKTVDEARTMYGVAASTVTRWRQVDQEFRDELDSARGRARLWAHEENYVNGVPGQFPDFVAKYFPDRRPHLPHQLELVRTLQSLEPREVVLFLLWPEAGKTATLEDYICRRLAVDPDHRFRIVSQTQEHATRMVAMVKRRFTDTSSWPEFIARFGPFYEKNQERSGRPWGADQITVLKATSEERDRSLVATSWRGGTTGSRIDTAIFDDVQTPENYNQAEEIFRRMRATFFTRGREMRTLIIGHRIGAGDLYDRLHDAGLITKEIVIPAAGARGAEPGYPSIPQWWAQHEIFHTHGACCGGLVQFRTCPNDGSRLSPVEVLELIKHQVGEEAWWSMYQQDPVSDAMTTFGKWVDDALDYDRATGPLVGVS